MLLPTHPLYTILEFARNSQAWVVEQIVKKVLSVCKMCKF